MVYCETWIYREEAGYEPGADLIGFSVEALDGSIGYDNESVAVNRTKEEIEAPPI